MSSDASASLGGCSKQWDECLNVVSLLVYEPIFGSRTLNILDLRGPLSYIPSHGLCGRQIKGSTFTRRASYGLIDTFPL